MVHHMPLVLQTTSHLLYERKDPFKCINECASNNNIIMFNKLTNYLMQNKGTIQNNEFFSNIF
jgi:hypothetical protein